MQTDGYAIMMFAYPFTLDDLRYWLGAGDITEEDVEITTLHDRLSVAYTKKIELAMIMWLRYENNR